MSRKYKEMKDVPTEAIELEESDFMRDLWTHTEDHAEKEATQTSIQTGNLSEMRLMISWKKAGELSRLSRSKLALIMM